MPQSICESGAKRAFGFLLAILSTTAALPAAADDVKPSAIVANPAAYEGKNVSVTGTVAKYQTSKTLMGAIAAFQLCDAKCIVVIDETNTAHKDGDTVTAAGTFQATFKGPKRSFDNVVVIK